METLLIRDAEARDLNFLVETDLLNEGYTTEADSSSMTKAERTAHREKIAAFIGAADQGGWIVEDPAGSSVGMILARFRDRRTEADTEVNRFLFRFLDASLFPADGRFCEVFQLWVHPAYRRQGIATRLKRVLEDECRKRGMRMIYTHTEAANEHVLAMNRNLGYQEVRRGPLWDEVVRVSLVKWVEEGE